MPFLEAETALFNMIQISENNVSEDLHGFLEANLPVVKKKKKTFILGVQDKILAGNISAALGIECLTSEIVTELFRGIRLHFNKFLKTTEFSEEHMVRAQLGLAHSFSRNKVQEDINRNDKHIIQSIALLEQLDKDVNLFCMRLKEWYSWHFPELARIVTDNYVYTKAVKAIGERENASEENIDAIEAAVGNVEIAQSIVEASNMSMGQDISEFDMVKIDIHCRNLLCSWLKDA